MPIFNTFKQHTRNQKNVAQDKDTAMPAKKTVRRSNGTDRTEGITSMLLRHRKLVSNKADPTSHDKRAVQRLQQPPMDTEETTEDWPHEDKHIQDIMAEILNNTWHATRLERKRIFQHLGVPKNEGVEPERDAAKKKTDGMVPGMPKSQIDAQEALRIMQT